MWRGRFLGTCAALLAVGGSLVLGSDGTSADTPTTPLPATSVQSAQSGVGPDLQVTWAPATDGTTATGAVVQLYEIVDEVPQFVSDITCGNGCTEVTFRSLSFGSTYEAAVWADNAQGAGTPVSSNAVTLGTLCPLGACVTIDATSPIGPVNHADSGILESVQPDGNDGADMTALGTTMYRSSPPPNGNGSFDWGGWNTATAAGAQTIMVLSDEYAAAYPGGIPPTPWSDWSAYNTEITYLVSRLVATGEPIDYWEVYNEPGGNDGYYSATDYATETPALLLEQFLDTYQDIKSVVPDAAIIGPSLEHWSDYPGQYGSADHAFDMATFLNYAAANDLSLAAVSWHEIDDNLGTKPEENTLSPTMIEDHVAEARQLIASLPALGNPKIFVDEYGMPEVQDIPGWDVSYLSALTASGVDSAVRACWDGNCSDGSLDGLLGSGGLANTPIYDERQIYASMTGQMVGTSSTNDWVTALASYDSTSNTLTALVGRGQGCSQNPTCPTAFPSAADAAPTSVNLNVTVPWDSGNAAVALTDVAGQVLNQAQTPNTSTEVVAVAPGTGSTGTVSVTIPQFADGDAYGVVITPTSASLPTPPPAPVTSPTQTPSTPASQPPAVFEPPGSCTAPEGGPHGYVMAASDGGIFTFGNIPFCGSTGGKALNRPIVGSALTPDGGGYWLVGSDGGIFAFGDAPFEGSTGGIHLTDPIVGMASTPDGKGYWLVGSDGGIFAFGDAPFEGSTGGIHLTHPIVGMAPTADGRGYWLVGSDGGVFAFGDAAFHGSMGGHKLDAPIIGIAADTATGGYWLAASDGGIFTFEAPFLGSIGGNHLNRPVVAMAPTSNGDGYRLVGSDGGIFSFGGAPFLGSMGGKVLNRPVVALAAG
ncbi:MAG TPA: hypothetical protein VGF87_04620 [Acidimicrobiales bacterium]